MTDGAVTYNLLTDNTMQLLFVLNIVGMAYVFLMNGSSIAERAKSIFYYGKQSNPFNDRTHITKICNMLLYLQTIFYCSIVAFAYMQYSTPFIVGATPHIVFAAFFLLFTIALLLKRVIYDACNLTLFSNTIAQEWRHSYFFTIKLTGFLLLPLVVCVIFVRDFSKLYYTIYLIFAMLIYIAVVISTAIKIIFKKKCNYLDIFLYLCALELLPMAFLWKTIHIPNAFLIIKF